MNFDFEWDSKRKTQALIAGGILAIILIIWALIPSDEEVVTDLPPKNKKEKVVKAPQRENQPEEKEKKPKYEVDLNLQTEFNSLVTNINTEVKKCQRGIAKLFPEDDPDDILPYQTAAELKSALDQFYGLVNGKIKDTNKVMKFFEEKNYERLDPKQTFEQLSQIEDCGDFEEESVVDSVITYVSDYSFSAADKKAVVTHIIKNFKDQLKMPIGLHHVMSKVESLESLLEEGLIAPHYQEDIARINQALEDSEEDFRRVLPLNMSEKKYLSPREVLEIKDRENEILERVKTTLGEILTQVEEGL